MCGGSGFVDKLKDQRRSAHTREGFRASHDLKNPAGISMGTRLGQNVIAAGGVGEDFAVETNRANAEEAATEAANAAALAFEGRRTTAEADRARRRRLRRSSLLASGGMESSGTGTLPAATPGYTLGA